MSLLAPHPSTALCREVLRHSLAEWAETVARGGRGRLRALSPGEGEGEGEGDGSLRVLYVDAFGYSGGRRLLTGGGTGTPEAESPLLGARALEGLARRAAALRLPLHAGALLVEEDPVLAEQLLRDLAAAGVEAVRRVEAVEAPAPGEVLVLHAPFAEAAEGVARRAAEAHHALCFLDPPTPGKLPLPAVRALAAAGAELLLAFPHADLEKQARYRGSPLADLPPHARRLVDGYGALLGDPRHAWLSLWRDAERREGPWEAELRVAEAYRARLVESGGAAARASLRLGADAGSLHLLLLSPDPERALLLNRFLREAGVEEERVAREEGLRMRLPPEEAASEVLELFSPAETGGASPAREEVPEADVGRLARTLAERFRGRTVAWGEVLLSVLDTDLSPEEVRRAMSALKRSGEALYRSLADPEAQVAFPSAPVPPPRRKRRGAPGEPEDLLPLLDEGS